VVVVVGVCLIQLGALAILRLFPRHKEIMVELDNRAELVLAAVAVLTL
jgi:hypothetical protein